MDIIIRDGEGETIGVAVPKFQNYGDKVLLMAEAALLALSFAADLSLYDIMIEADCVDLFLALQNPEKCLALFGTLVKDIQWRASHFRKVVFSFTNSLYNQVAHVIAKEALKRNSIGIWVEECPPFLLN